MVCLAPKSTANHAATSGLVMEQLLPPSRSGFGSPSTALPEKVQLNLSHFANHFFLEFI